MSGKKEFFKTENIVGVLFFLFALAFPMFSSAYEVDNFTGFYIVILMSLSLSLIWGFTGIFSFGQAAFYGIGAYTYGIISLMNDNSNFTLIGILAGILVPGIVAGILGYFMFYGGISDIFIGIITMCVSIVLQTFMVQTSGPEWKIAGVALGGYNGLNNIPAIHIGDYALTGIPFYFVVVIIVMCIYIAFRKLEKSKWGYTLFGVRESKMRSELFGYNTAKIQTIVFGISGALAGLGGVLFAAHSAYVVPDTLSTATSTLVVVMVATAGRKNVTGAVVMTLLYSWFSQYLATTGSQYSQIILGVLLVVVIVFVPDGILVALFRKSDELIQRISGRRMEAEYGKKQ